MKNIDNKIQTLKESYKEVEDVITLREYAENQKQSDPGFIRWLLNNGDLDDFGNNMTAEQESEYQEFLSKL